MIEDPRSGLRSAAEALQDQQDGLEQAKVITLSAKTAQPGRPRRATCHTQRLECNIKLGFQPSQTLILVSNPFPQPRVWLPAILARCCCPSPTARFPPAEQKKWLVSCGEGRTERCGELQRLPRLACATRTIVIWGGSVMCDVRQR